MLEADAIPLSAADMEFEVLEGYAATKPWLDAVSQASDSHRNELGFFARSVFDQFASRDGIYVLVERSRAGIRYAGHLLFDRRFPRAHVRQIFIVPDYRRQGGASVLLDRLRRSLAQHCFISIYARVAEDLVEANAFWQRQHFYVQRSESGGASRNRQILVRSHELESPQLFPTSGVGDHNPLGLVAPATNESPMFLLDMNVLFDLQPRRRRREEAVSLFQAERLNLCRLAISEEIRSELRRTMLQGQKTDPMAALADTLPCVPVDPANASDTLLAELARLVFPKASVQGVLTTNARSDLRHIITAIRNDLAGLITNDTALLDAASAIEEQYRVQVLSPASFLIDDDAASHLGSTFESGEHATLHLRPVSNVNEPTVRSFLSQKAQLSGSEITAGWLSIDSQNHVTNRCAVWSGDTCIGCITWPKWTTNDAVITRAAVDESHPQALEAARILLLYLVDHLNCDNPRQVGLVLPRQQANLREVAAGLGFAGRPRDQQLMKSVLGRLVTPSTWTTDVEALADAGGPRLPSQLPDFRGAEQQMAVATPDGNRVYISLDRLESLLSPALFCLPGRPAVITPIRREYAEPLLGHSVQDSFLPQLSASLYTERHYFSHPNTLRHFRRGTLMFFYESSKGRGRCQLVAVGRVREAYLRFCDAMDVSDLLQSVLTTKHLAKIGKSQMKTVTVFDNIFPIPHPVGLRSLQQLGCGKSIDLLTTHPISEQQLQAILAEGFNRD